jgi:putative transposase
VIALLDVARQLLADVLRFAIVALRPTRVVSAENLFLRRQLAMYIERGVKPRRPDVATRVRLALLSSNALQRLAPAHGVRAGFP